MNSSVEFKFFNAEGQRYYINTITQEKRWRQGSAKHRTRTITPSVIMRVTKYKGLQKQQNTQRVTKHKGL